MIQVILFGACGRMGRVAAEEIAAQPDLELVAAVESPGHPKLGAYMHGAPIIADGEGLPQADVCLDFSLAEPSLAHLRLAKSRRLPFILATTGFSPAQLEEIADISGAVPLMLAPNLSSGIAALQAMLPTAGSLVAAGFDALIVEAHHRDKRDAPSGTAARLAEKLKWKEGKVTILSIRGGGQPGEHQVRLMGQDEELVITHRVWSRRAFARGAVQALRFMVGKPPGLYRPEDVFRTG